MSKAQKAVLKLQEEINSIYCGTDGVAPTGYDYGFEYLQDTHDPVILQPTAKEQREYQRYVHSKRKR